MQLVMKLQNLGCTSLVELLGQGEPDIPGGRAVKNQGNQMIGDQGAEDCLSFALVGSWYGGGDIQLVIKVPLDQLIARSLDPDPVVGLIQHAVPGGNAIFIHLVIAVVA